MYGLVECKDVLMMMTDYDAFVMHALSIVVCVCVCVCF